MRKKKKKASVETKILEINADMQGTLTFREPVHLVINGSFNGYLDTKGYLEIGENGEFKGDIQGDEIVIAGRVEGNIFADHSLKIKEKGSLKGDINVKSFDLDFGASFEGSCRMKVMPASSGDEMSLDDVADYLNVDVKRVKSWVETHEIPAEDIDGHYIINMADLEEWVSKQPLEVK